MNFRDCVRTLYYLKFKGILKCRRNADEERKDSAEGCCEELGRRRNREAIPFISLTLCECQDFKFMLHMDNIVLTSIIAAGSACLGALIPSLFSLLGKKQEYAIERLAKIDDVRREEFAIYLDSLQRMVNEGNRDIFFEIAGINK